LARNAIFFRRGFPRANGSFEVADASVEQLSEAFVRARSGFRISGDDQGALEHLPRRFHVLGILGEPFEAGEYRLVERWLVEKGPAEAESSFASTAAGQLLAHPHERDLAFFAAEMRQRAPELFCRGGGVTELAESPKQRLMNGEVGRGDLERAAPGRD